VGLEQHLLKPHRLLCQELWRGYSDQSGATAYVIKKGAELAMKPVLPYRQPGWGDRRGAEEYLR
jgi:hypothetical protein